MSRKFIVANLRIAELCAACNATSVIVKFSFLFSSQVHFLLTYYSQSGVDIKILVQYESLHVIKILIA